MYPTQRVQANVELAGIVAQHDRIAQELMRANAALGGDCHRGGGYGQRREAEPLKLS
jgi:hypothetical protein